MFGVLPLGNKGSWFVPPCMVPTNRQLTGYVFLPARVKAIAPDGYRFVGWKNTRDQILSVSNEFDLSDSYECIIASFEPDGIDKRPIRINEISAGKYILRAVQSQKVTFFRSIVWGGTHTTNINHSR